MLKSSEDREKVVNIYVLASGWSYNQECDNKLVKELVKRGFKVQVYSYDSDNEEVNLKKKDIAEAEYIKKNYFKEVDLDELKKNNYYNRPEYDSSYRKIEKILKIPEDFSKETYIDSFYPVKGDDKGVLFFDDRNFVFEEKIKVTPTKEGDYEYSTEDGKVKVKRILSYLCPQRRYNECVKENKKINKKKIITEDKILKNLNTNYNIIINGLGTVSEDCHGGDFIKDLKKNLPRNTAFIEWCRCCTPPYDGRQGSPVGSLSYPYGRYMDFVDLDDFLVTSCDNSKEIERKNNLRKEMLKPSVFNKSPLRELLDNPILYIDKEKKEERIKKGNMFFRGALKEPYVNYLDLVDKIEKETNKAKEEANLYKTDRKEIKDLFKNKNEVDGFKEILLQLKKDLRLSSDQIYNIFVTANQNDGYTRKIEGIKPCPSPEERKFSVKFQQLCKKKNILTTRPVPRREVGLRTKRFIEKFAGNNIDEQKNNLKKFINALGI